MTRGRDGAFEKQRYRGRRSLPDIAGGEGFMDRAWLTMGGGLESLSPPALAIRSEPPPERVCH